MFIYYRFMVCFPIGLDFLLIIFLLHFFLSCGIFLVSVLPDPLLHSLTMSFLVFHLAFNSKLHTFHHPTIHTFPHHMSIPSQSTTSNNSYDRLQLQQVFSIIHMSFCLSFNHLYICSFKL